jgi:hypothetical protein
MEKQKQNENVIQQENQMQETNRNQTQDPPSIQNNQQSAHPEAKNDDEQQDLDKEWASMKKRLLGKKSRKIDYQQLLEFKQNMNEKDYSFYKNKFMILNIDLFRTEMFFLPAVLDIPHKRIKDFSKVAGALTRNQKKGVQRGLHFFFCLTGDWLILRSARRRRRRRLRFRPGRLRLPCPLRCAPPN